jgi:hypothetical protein
MTFCFADQFLKAFLPTFGSSNSGLAIILTNSEFYKVPGDPWSYDLDNRPGAEIDAGIHIAVEIVSVKI